MREFDKLGYLGTAHLLIRTKQGVDSVNLIKQLSTIENVIIATRATGSYDLYAVLAFREVKELYHRILKLKELPDVLTIDLSFGIPGLENFPPKQV